MRSLPEDLFFGLLWVLIIVVAASAIFASSSSSNAVPLNPAVACQLHKGVNSVAVDRYGSVAAFTCRDGSYFKVAY